MKTIYRLVLIFTTLMSLSLAGCGKESNEHEEKNNDSATEKDSGQQEPINDDLPP